MNIKLAEKNEIDVLAYLAVMLWEDNTIDGLKAEFADIMEKGECAFFIAYEDNQPAGFAQCQLRHDYVEGTDSGFVGYLEGVFVREQYRGKGYAKALLQRCEAWALSQGCKEFASDCELTNTDSFKFHINTGFKEVNRIICFTKKL